MFKNRKHSDESKNKISKSNKGKHFYWIGRKMSDITKKKMSLINSGINNPMFGKHHSLNTKLKISKSRIGRCGGDKCNFWKGGINPINDTIRKSSKFKLWRESVFTRDNYTCQKYGIIGGKLHPHHIQNFAKFPELRFAIDNGITLSEKAHREFHKKYGRINNTREQLIEFLNID